jgi:myxalamid-type nonribosomal peptide synthetase MxaA
VSVNSNPLQGLSQERAKLLEALLERRSLDEQRIKPCPRSAEPEPVRLVTSWAQQRLWFIEQLEGAGAAYNIPIVMRLNGVLCKESLRQALDLLVQRHEALRTVFVDFEGDPRQEIAPHGSFGLQVLDLSGLDGEQREIQLALQIADEAQTPFDLRNGPLIRGRLLRLDHSRHVLLMTMHHIIADGWSVGVLIRDVAELYSAQLTRREPSLPRLQVQYADYAHWQRQWLQGECLDRQLRYWRARLEGAVPELELPTDRPRPAVHRYRGEYLPITLDATLTADLRALARRHNMTLFMVLYATWALLLARLSGQADIVIGTPVANRPRPELEGLIGFFVNTLALRVEAANDLRLPEFLQQVREVTLGAYDHQDIPFEQLVEALRPDRSLGRHPIFQVMFVLQNAPQSQLGLPGLTATLEDSANGTSKFDLLLSLVERGDALVGSINYDTDLFDRRTVERWIASLVTLLRGITHGEQQHIGNLPILTDDDRDLIASFNATHRPRSAETLVHRLFEQQAKLTPAAVAVLHDQQMLTYAQLDASATHLASRLRAMGVGADQLVGVCLERNLEMLVGLIAILKAGGAYLPLDPNYPGERLQYMLHDAAPRVVLTQQSLRSLLPASSAEVIELDGVLQRSCRESAENAAIGSIEPNARNLLYVIYTSGSTGRPKGTAMPHGAMVNLIEWHREQFGHENQRRVLQFAALSFDVAFQEIFSTLCTGSTLVLLDESVRRDAAALVSLMNAQRVERLFLPPLMLQALAECFRATGAIPHDLTAVITAGEQLRITPEIVDFFQRLPRCRLHNHYGPTETHVVTALTLDQDPRRWPVLPTIGRPIANTRIHVLDAMRQAVPLGVVGEIYISGANVARGYLNRAELSAERFLPDPFHADRSQRMYKTGDLGRWREDGVIEYLGRNDDQVKIRGFRIELGEIETCLRMHDGIKEAAVIAREDTPGQRRLVAYVAARTPTVVDVEILRAHLRGILPEHMVPSAFVFLDRMPTTPSGKVNRRALPAPDIAEYQVRDYEPPRGEVEEALARIWQQLLQVERIGRHDNFFDLGGHSLLVLKALFRINQCFRCSLNVTDVYKTPCLRELAARISGTAVEDRLVDLSREATLDCHIIARAGARRIPEHVVLLTGATGFVGRFLLAQLLRDTNARVLCLVRAASQHQAAVRLKAMLEKWDLWHDDFARRSVAVAGDLRQPRLGVDGPSYELLARDVDSIYHCGASMNHLETYAMAKAANVDAARELLQLATDHTPKLINYISTLGVFSAATTGLPRVVEERSSIDDEKHWHASGYVASKWVGEKLFMLAGERGIPCNIFRLGLVWADAQQGRYDELQRGYRILKSCLLSGCGIRNHRFEMPPTPVDYAARAVVALARKHADGKGVFHISSAAQMSGGMFDRCNEFLESPLRLLPLYDWVCEMRRLHEAGRSLPVVPLIEFAFSMDERTFYENERRMRAREVRFDCSRTLRELDVMGLRPPALDDDLLRLCVRSLVERDEELAQQEWFAPDSDESAVHPGRPPRLDERSISQ